MTDGVAAALNGEGSRPILEVRGLVKRFGGVHAVNDASFEVKAGSITALIGPNGAGKTTLFNVISGFAHADSGDVIYQGGSVVGKPPYVIARLGMVRTFQITKVLAAMPVIDNIMLGAPNQPGEHVLNVMFRPIAVRKRETDVRNRALALLEVSGLASKANDYAGTLSGGQRKLLELARALMAEPRLVLLDEPIAGVNQTMSLQLLEYIEELRDQDGISFLFIEHDMDVVMRRADTVVVMAQGAVIAEGSPSAVRTNTVVIDAYLGERSDRTT